MLFFLKKYFFKAIKRARIIAKINFCVSIKYNGKKVIIPFIRGVGLTNFLLKRNFLDYLIKNFADFDKGIFVDVGVNIGQSMIRLKTKYPEMEYLGFEPNASCVSYSQNLIEKNRFEYCRLYNCALSTEIQTLELYKTLTTDSRASMVSELRPNVFSNKEQILALDFDSVFKKQKIVFIKIDVEGAEYEVLKGMSGSINEHQPIITCEVLDSHNSETMDFTRERANMVSDLLHTMNYGIIQLHTENNRVASYKNLQSFEIKQWTTSSSYCNDYLFFPEAKREMVESTLHKTL